MCISVTHFLPYRSVGLQAMQNVRRQNVVELHVGYVGVWPVRGVYPSASMPPNWQK